MVVRIEKMVEKGGIIITKKRPALFDVFADTPPVYVRYTDCNPLKTTLLSSLTRLALALARFTPLPLRFHTLRHPPPDIIRLLRRRVPPPPRTRRRFRQDNVRRFERLVDRHDEEREEEAGVTHSNKRVT